LFVEVNTSFPAKFDNIVNNASLSVIQKFDEPVYLHQVRVFDHHTGELKHRFSDLDDAIKAEPEGSWIIHFHVPLYFAGNDVLTSTNNELTSEFLELVFKNCPNIEIETYTLNIMPDNQLSIVDSIVKEFNWVRERVNSGE